MKRIALLLVLGVASISAGVTHLLVDPGNAIERAYGVISQCGVHAVIVVRRDGSSTIYSAASPQPESVQQEVAALPTAKRHAVVVPCPPQRSQPDVRA